MNPQRPKLAVFKFASCDGCQLTLLDCEDELLSVAGKVDVAYFLEASSHVEPGPYDIALVEGSITTPDDLERIERVRRESKILITIGACATAGGIQALRNWADVDEFTRGVYARPEFIRTLARSTPISEHVRVDFELRGCPIDKRQLLAVLSAFIAGRRPQLPNHSVCLDCKRRGTVCVMVAQGIACLGPVTHTGCGALCPSYDRGCYGCFGPAKQPNLIALSTEFAKSGVGREDIGRSLRSFNGYAPEFRGESDRLLDTQATETPDGR